jgi:hypothetical protein
LETVRDANGVTISVPQAAPDKISSTVVLKIKGAPEVETAPICQGADGSVRLLASDAELHGAVKYETVGGEGNIGYWTNPQDTVSWTFKVERPGKFTLAADLAAVGAGQFDVLLGEQKLRATAPRTKVRCPGHRGRSHPR